MALIWGEKYSVAGLRALIAEAGVYVRVVDGVEECSDETAAQAIIDGYDPLPPAKAEKLAAVRAEAQARIFAIYPAWRQSNAALGIVPDADVLAMQDFIADHIDASNAAEDAIAAATTVAEVEGVTPLWP